MVALRNIRYCAYFRLRDGLVLASPAIGATSQGVKFEAALKEACGKKLKQEDQLSADIEGCVLHLVAGVIDGVAVATPGSYPKDKAYKLATSIRDKIQETMPEEAVEAAEAPQQLSSVLSDPIERFCAIYDNPDSAEKLIEVMQKVEEVKIVMEENIDRILDNTEDLRGVESKGDKLVSDAGMFQKSAEEVRRIIYWRNMKIKIIVGVVAVVVAMYIIIPTTLALT